MAKASKPPIINKVYDAPTVPWKELKKYEANRLKDSEKRNVQKLKQAILDGGFSFPLIAWNPGNGVDPNYVIDGAGRIAALTALEKDGHEICDIPVVFVEAKDREEAKVKVAMASSQFGFVTADTFRDFTADLGGGDAIAPICSISSTAFASDYMGPAIPAGEEKPKKRRGNTNQTTQILEFEPSDIIEFGTHQLMPGYDRPEVIKKILKFIQKEFPDLEITNNGAVMPDV